VILSVFQNKVSLCDALCREN